MAMATTLQPVAVMIVMMAMPRDFPVMQKFVTMATTKIAMTIQLATRIVMATVM